MLRKIILNWRYYVLLAIDSISIIGIFGYPESYEGIAWILAFVISKIIGFYFGYLHFRLFEYWDSRNKVTELSSLINMEE